MQTKLTENQENKFVDGGGGALAYDRKLYILIYNNFVILFAKLMIQNVQIGPTIKIIIYEFWG